MAIVYLVDRGDPENADFFAGQSNGFRVWMERSSVEWAERTAREFSEVDLYLVERYKDGWVLRSLRSATPFEGHARRIARQDARMPEAIRNVLSPASPYRPIVHGQSKNPPLSTSTVNAAMSMRDVTPGYNRRLSIAFTTDKRGKVLAYYWSGAYGGRAAVGGLGRWIRMPLANAHLLHRGGVCGPGRLP